MLSQGFKPTRGISLCIGDPLQPWGSIPSSLWTRGRRRNHDGICYRNAQLYQEIPAIFFSRDSLSKKCQHYFFKEFTIGEMPSFFNEEFTIWKPWKPTIFLITKSYQIERK